MDLPTFQGLPDHEVAELVRSSGSKVCVFPINGTRRWFMFEHGNQEWDDPIAAYMDISAKHHIELYKMFFDHGIDTLIAPVIGPEILATRDAYMQKIGGEGLARYATHPDFLSFYDEYDVRVRFYGDYRKNLAGTVYAHLSDLFDSLPEKTRGHTRCRLFYGAFADNLNATYVVAELAVKYFQEFGIIPNREKIVEMYYGEYVAKANIFIGFDRFAVFDYPLINWGEEDLYFTLAPSPYIDRRQLRDILYDHMYTRRTLEPEYSDMAPEQVQELYDYYQQQRGRTLGTGKLLNSIWIPDVE